MLCSGGVAIRSRSWAWSQRDPSMCKPRSGSDASAASRPAAPSSRRSSSSSAKPRLAAAGVSSSSPPFTSSYSGVAGAPSGTGTGTASAQRRGATSSSSTSSGSSSRASLAAARASLPDTPVLYPFQELAAATNSFLAKRAGASGASSSSASSYWRCSLRGRDAALFQLQRRPDAGAAAVDAAALARIGRYHHTSLARLLGACPAGAHLYLAYELPPGGGATLAACLRGPRNPSFTSLRTWVSRVQVAADVAQGLEYVHHHAGSVHGRVSPAAVIVSDPGLRARLTHLGAAELAAPADGGGEDPYAAPGSSGEPSREVDVYAFGVLLLELLSGEEPARYRFDRGTKEFQRVSVLETAAAAAAGGTVRNWVDRRLGDSFPVAAAERLVEVALRCAAADDDRPDMTWVAGKVSKLYLESRAWEQKVQMPTEFSVSVAPR